MEDLDLAAGGAVVTDEELVELRKARQAVFAVFEEFEKTLGHEDSELRQKLNRGNNGLTVLDDWMWAKG